MQRFAPPASSRRLPATGIAVVQVPPPPLLGPVFDKYGDRPEAVARRFLDRVAKTLHGDFGDL